MFCLIREDENNRQEMWAIVMQFLLQMYFCICMPKIVKLQCGLIELL